MNQSHNNNTPKIVGAIVISAIMLIGIYTLIIKQPDPTTLASDTAATSTQTVATATPTTTDTATTTATTAPTQVTTTTTTSGYKDGTYTETVSYHVPGETNRLTAKVTLKDGAITSVSTTSSYGDRESSRYISGFESSINKAVSGKSLANAYIGRVGGASLTSSAFNDVIDPVMSDAKA